MPCRAWVLVMLVFLVFAATANAYLHPGIGRFMQRDPLGYVDGMGLYGYQGSDPSGLQTLPTQPGRADWWGQAAAAVDRGCDLADAPARPEAGLRLRVAEEGCAKGY